MEVVTWLMNFHFGKRHQSSCWYQHYSYTIGHFGHRTISTHDICSEVKHIQYWFNYILCRLFWEFFSSLQHLRSYQDVYRLCTHGNFIVLPTGKSGHQYHDLISHSVTLSWYWTNQSLPYPNNAEHQDKERQVSMLKSLVWFDQGLKPHGPDLNLWSSDSPIPQNGRRMVYSFGHPDWLL